MPAADKDEPAPSPQEKRTEWISREYDADDRLTKETRTETVVFVVPDPRPWPGQFL